MDKPLGITEEIARAQAGDREAFAALVDAHYDFIFRIAWKWSGDRQDAEDVTQDVCIKLASALAGFSGQSGFKSWLYRIVLNAVRDGQRQTMRRARQAEALKHVSAWALAPEQESATANAQIWQRVRALPGRQRDAVLLVYGEEMSHAEAAAIMGTRESTVSWYVHEARKALKELV